MGNSTILRELIVQRGRLSYLYPRALDDANCVSPTLEAGEVLLISVGLIWIFLRISSDLY